jgi:hypothetical protein
MTELQKVQQISEEVDIDRAKQRFKKMHEETFLVSINQNAFSNLDLNLIV